MTRCKNCMRTLALALTLVLSLSVSVPARAAVDETNANRLNALGLFSAPAAATIWEASATRLHGIIMLTRMLGEEADALSFDGPCPFSDVAAGKPSAYTGYAFAQGYTTGVSTTTFQPKRRSELQALCHVFSCGHWATMTAREISPLPHRWIKPWRSA